MGISSKTSRPGLTAYALTVMAGRVPAIHPQAVRARMAGTRPAMTVSDGATTKESHP
jgi:hypothetical protein